MAVLLESLTQARALSRLSLQNRRSPLGCTSQVARLLRLSPERVFTVAELRGELAYQWTGRRVNSVLQKMVAKGEAQVARLGNPKGYRWVEQSK